MSERVKNAAWILSGGLLLEVDYMGGGGKGRGRGRGAPLRKGLFSDTVRKVRKTSKRIVRA